MAWAVCEVRVCAFKSFGATITTLRISSPFVMGIAGPNGAGKSNILDALCFASGCPPSVLRVKTLRELANSSGPPELCFVEYGITQALPGATQLGQALHWVRAALNAEGTREYKIDGKVKSGLQVTAFLHAHGLYFDSDSSVIRQAQVTRLADNNARDGVAEVVADASGLTRWIQEASRANEELATTRRALVDISASMRTLRSAMNMDEQDMQQASKADSLDVQIDQAAEGLAQGLRRQLRALGASVRAQSAAKERLVCEARGLARQQEELGASIRQAAAEAQEEREQRQQPGEARQGMAALVKRVSAAEAEVQAACRQLEAARRLEAQARELLRGREELRQQAARLEAEARGAAQLRDVLQEMQQGGTEEAAATEALLRQLEGAAAAAAAAAGELREAAAAAGQAATQAEEEQARAEAAARAASAARDEAEARRQQAVDGGREGGSVGGVAAAAAAARKQLEEAEARLGRASIRRQVLQRQAPHLVGNGGGGGGRGPDPAAAPLHQCFAFKRQQQEGAPPGPSVGQGQGQGQGAAPPPMQRFVKALATVAGSHLGVVVCASKTQAARLLENPQQALARQGQQAGSGKLRIWPLDSITAPDTSARLKRVAETLGPGRAWLPLDLLEPATPAYAACLRRAFGHMLIVADEDAASEASATHGLACVTLDGLVSRPGTVSGGWRGHGPSPNEALLLTKLELESVAAEEREMVAEVERLMGVVRRTEGEEDEQAAAMEEAEQRAGEAAAAAAQAAEAALEAARARGEARRLEGEAEAAEAEARRCGECLAAAQRQQRQQQQRRQQGEGGKRSQRELAEELGKARSKHDELRASHEEAVEKLEELESKLEETMCLLDVRPQDLERQQQQQQQPAGSSDEGSGNSSMEDVDALLVRSSAAKAGQLAEAQVRLRGLSEQLERARAAEEEQQRRRVEAAQRQRQAEKSLKQAKEEAKRVKAYEVATEQRLRAHQAALGKAHAALTQLLSGFPHLAPAYGGGDGEEGAEEGPAAGEGPVGGSDGAGEDEAARLARAQEEVGALSATLQWLKAERAKIHIRQVPLAEQLLRQERVATLQQLSDHYTSLQEAVESLDQGIAGARKQVLQANEAVFAATAVAFRSLCAMMLPSMSLSLVKTQECASKGVEVRFERNSAAAAGTAGAGAESGSLEQLSGGQRTLVSLALLLAAAQNGSHSSVLLLDEVDAALDEHNQRTVARLLRDLSHRGGLQLICVSHNKASHQACDALVHISRNVSSGCSVVDNQQGTTAAATLAAAPAAAAPARKQPGRAQGQERRKRRNRVDQ